MKIEVRQVSHPDAVRAYGTDDLRRHFLIESVFETDEIVLTYSHIDRLVIGGALPATKPLKLSAPTPIGQEFFLAQRELGVINIGGKGRISLDGAVHELATRDCLYIGKGIVDVVFESADKSNPAKFYLLSTPAHAVHLSVLIKPEQANQVQLGDQLTSNKRTIYQYIHPDVCESCQLVMGLTQLAPGNMWNTMPSHTHDRRSEAYLYFDLAADQRIFHMMGEPSETRHLVVANEQAILSPGWSIHSGVGTANYAFIWAMGGDNKSFTDMDMIPISALR
ncbi:5-dehydro-4-deoxy-D-glucuronate isomerase (plasmid) [Phyllobacterium sp. 628]|uniref:5-dehydro-4-deoxy-D-glucuronate isomerase n=1 Tax=Phyllobacterium sp. 628 TaxID=2718938 RepID=UPI0016623F1B|nr:5-dehydro-4-deoxy-D-glucuronate isomerase [Phyllobacterium sp. 628]QND54934.1 5-dehydro-4-deoxy-D-glucuronate isomerase [Phyllobacterium sp. 628]